MASHHDVFISHASEDKSEFVAPLADLLAEFGTDVWYDAFTLSVGDSLSRSIDEGLAKSRYGVVVLSPAFLRKPWPEYELRGLVSREIGRDKVILPIWHGVGFEDVLKFSPPLADKLALNSKELDLPELALQLLRVIRPDLHDHLARRMQYERLKADATQKSVRVSDIKLGAVKHDSLDVELAVRIKLHYLIFAEVLEQSFDDIVDLFSRDIDPCREMHVWERIGAAYLEFQTGRDLSLEARKEVLAVLLGISTGALNEERAGEFEHVSYDEVMELGTRYMWPHRPA